MRKFKIFIQNTVFCGDIPTNQQEMIISKEIECDRYSLDKEKYEVTKDNIKLANQYIDVNLKVGDFFYSPLMSVSFLENDNVKETVNVFADPYYELYEFIDDKYVLIDKHECRCNHRMH